MKTFNRIARDTKRFYSSSLSYSLYAFALLISMLLSAGCENASSPTSPVSEVLSKQTTASSAEKGSVLHAILVVDTNTAGELATYLQQDLDKMNSFVDSIAASTGMGLQKQIYSGGRATIANLNQAVQDLNPGPDDAILFYFSGHGGRTAQTSTQWPDMYLQQAGVSLYDVFSRLRGKGSRLVVALSNSCNVVFENIDEALKAQQWASVRSTKSSNLFLEGRANIIASSSAPGEVTFAGLFTDQFISAISSASSWTAAMDKATRRIQSHGVWQQPQYSIY